ncbi:hypothetical protein AX16_006595 [Volvariella volvacea WC 439]|nr:hypothetical protein AX16_006595 [Volvariella volvacea WC 439]
MASSNAGERILSIQSHVVFGYVGGKAAVFPLQCLGYDVDVVNTVNYANHAGYGRSGGSKTTSSELASIFRSLEENELLFPTRLLTGYIPGAEALSSIADLARKLKQEKPELVYLLDPVMGDAGTLYVAPEVIPVYRTMLPLASIITPNWFEVETLTSIQIVDFPTLREALRRLHKQYQVPNVVISSIPLKLWLWEALPIEHRPPISKATNFVIPVDRLVCITSTLIPHYTQSASSPMSIIHAETIPLIPGYFSGVGDLFSALLLGHYDISAPALPTDDLTELKGNPPETTPLTDAASEALTKTHAMLQETHKHYEALPEDERTETDVEQDKVNPLRKTRRMRGRELRLIQCQNILRGIGITEVRKLKPWKGFWDM